MPKRGCLANSQDAPTVAARCDGAQHAGTFLSGIGFYFEEVELWTAELSLRTPPVFAGKGVEHSRTSGLVDAEISKVQPVSRGALRLRMDGAERQR